MSLTPPMKDAWDVFAEFPGDGTWLRFNLSDIYFGLGGLIEKVEKLPPWVAPPRTIGLDIDSATLAMESEDLLIHFFRLCGVTELLLSFTKKTSISTGLMSLARRIGSDVPSLVKLTYYNEGGWVDVPTFMFLVFSGTTCNIKHLVMDDISKHRLSDVLFFLRAAAPHLTSLDLEACDLQNENLFLSVFEALMHFSSLKHFRMEMGCELPENAIVSFDALSRFVGQHHKKMESLIFEGDLLKLDRHSIRGNYDHNKEEQEKEQAVTQATQAFFDRISSCSKLRTLRLHLDQPYGTSIVAKNHQCDCLMLGGLNLEKAADGVASLYIDGFSLVFGDLWSWSFLNDFISRIGNLRQLHVGCEYTELVWVRRLLGETRSIKDLTLRWWVTPGRKEEQALRAVYEALKSYGTLTRLSLPICSPLPFDDQVVCSSSNLEELELSFEPGIDESLCFASMTRMLLSLRNLRRLSVAKLAWVSRENSQHNTSEDHFRSFSEGHFHSFSEAVRFHPKLKELKVDSEYWTEKARKHCIKHLLDVLATPEAKMESLDVSKFQVAIDQLVTFIPKVKCLTSLVLPLRNISNGDWELLVPALNENLFITDIEGTSSFFCFTHKYKASVYHIMQRNSLLARSRKGVELLCTLPQKTWPHLLQSLGTHSHQESTALFQFLTAKPNAFAALIPKRSTQKRKRVPTED